MFFFCFFVDVGETLRTGPQPQVAAPQTNNHQIGFKRQNTVDSATIKENSARLNARPASAQPKTATENSEFCFFGVLKVFCVVSLSSFLM